MNVGIIGTNFISDEFIDAARKVGTYTIHSICSRSMETGRIFAKRHHIPHVYTELESFFADPVMDMVYIASPNSFHSPQAIAAMRHGKHVLVEKPIASNLAELEKMEQAAKENHVVMMEAMRPAYLPSYDWVASALKRIGTVRSVDFHFCQYSRRYDRFKQGEILNAFNPALSNAALMDIGVYVLHTFLKLFGRPQTVTASAVKLSNGMEGCGSALFSYPEMTATLSWSKISDDPTPSRIIGENGFITIDHISKAEEIVMTLRNGAVESFVARDIENNMIYELMKFHNLIAQPQDQKEDILYTTRLCMELMDEIRRQTGIVFPADIF